MHQELEWSDVAMLSSRPRARWTWRDTEAHDESQWIHIQNIFKRDWLSLLAMTDWIVKGPIVKNHAQKLIQYLLEVNIGDDRRLTSFPCINLTCSHRNWIAGHCSKLKKKISNLKSRLGKRRKVSAQDLDFKADCISIFILLQATE